MERTASESSREDRQEQTHRDAERETDEGRAENDRPPLASLHRAVGNQAVQELHEQGKLQAKLAVSQPSDRSEREAERVAEAVLAEEDLATERADVATVDRQTAGGTDATVDDETESEIRSVTSGGRPLSASERSFFEPRFGRDFSDVRVHTGSHADEAARSINADAFTVGNDIVFAGGNYEPGTAQGRELLAHELTHVVQQMGPPQLDTDADRSSGATRTPNGRDESTTGESVSRSAGRSSGTYVQRIWPFTGGEEDSSEGSSDGGNQQQQQQQQKKKLSPNNLSKRTQRVLLGAGYGGMGKIPKPVVETAREVAKIEKELANDDNVTFYAVCNALVANAYPTKTDANSWQIKFQGAVDDSLQFSNALSVGKDIVRSVLEEALGAPEPVSMAIDAYNGLHRSPRLKTVHEVKTGGPAGEEEQEIVENWEDDVLNYVLLDTDEKKRKYNLGERTLQRRERERLDKMLKLANALDEAGLGGGNTGASAYAR
jgi:hypothetical protein